MSTKKKSKKKRTVTKDSQLKQLSTWPDPSQAKIKLNFVEVINDDKKLIEKINDLNNFAVSVEDFLSLNGDVSVYGWQHVMNFALYEKYNFLLPLLKQNLDNIEMFKELVGEETHGLKDFVYVYCTMLTLILRRLKPENSLYLLLSKFLNALKLEDALDDAVGEFEEDKKVIIVPKGWRRPDDTDDTGDYTNRYNLYNKGTQHLILGTWYRLQETKDNGNCFFEAVLRGVYYNRGIYNTAEKDDEYQRRVTKFTSGNEENMFSEENIYELRKKLAEFVNPNQGLLSDEDFKEKKKKSKVIYAFGEALTSEYVRIKNRNDHANHLKKNKEFNEEPDVHLIGLFFDICIVIIRWNNNPKANNNPEAKGWYANPEKKDCEKKPIVYIVHTGASGTNETHYDALIPVNLIQTY